MGEELSGNTRSAEVKHCTKCRVQPLSVPLMLLFLHFCLCVVTLLSSPDTFEQSAFNLSSPAQKHAVFMVFFFLIIKNHN